MDKIMSGIRKYKIYRCVMRIVKTIISEVKKYFDLN